jgi:Secretion system C-terminal sorting domain
MRKTFTLFALACLGLGLQAQFVRTDMGDAGSTQKYRKADTTGVQNGAAGAGQNWDYTTLVASPAIGINNYVVASAHPQGAMFPTADIAFAPANGNYAFYESSADSLYMIGEKSPSNTTISYTNGAAWFRYPQALGVANTDSVYGSYPDGFISTVDRKGWIQTTFDGDGSLVTPFMTFPTVKRVEYLAIHHDSSWTGAAEVDVFVRRYEWYATGRVMPVLIINRQQVILNNGNPTNSIEVWWADDNAVAVTPAIADQFAISPNPSRGHARLNYTLDATGDVRVEVLNLVGERVRLLVDANQAAGAYTLDLGSDLAAGVYMVRMQTAAGVTTQKMIVN